MEISPAILLQGIGSLIVVGTAWVSLSNKIASIKTQQEAMKENHDSLQKSFNSHKEKSEETLEAMRKEIRNETDTIKELIHKQNIMLTEINVQLNPKNKS